MDYKKTQMIHKMLILIREKELIFEKKKEELGMLSAEIDMLREDFIDGDFWAVESLVKRENQMDHYGKEGIERLLKAIFKNDHSKK